MNLNIHNKEIKILKYISIAHIFFSIISICIHFIGLKKLYFISKILYSFFKYFSILIIFFITIPMTILFLLYKRNNPSIKILRWIILYFLFIFLITGLLVNISSWKTSIEAELFIKNCPYHYNHSLVKLIIDKYFKKNKNKSFKLCDERFCYLNTEVNNNSLSYNYICNYDSSKDFNYKNDGTLYKRIDLNGKEIISNIYISCTQIISILTSDESLFTYSNLCNHNIFYSCELFEQPKEKDITSINNKESCPELNYKIISYLLSSIILLIDLICFSFIILELFSLKKILIRNIGNNNYDLAHKNEYSTKIIKFDNNNKRKIENERNEKEEERIKNKGIFNTKKENLNNVSLISENEKDNNKKEINEIKGIQNKNPSFISGTGDITSSSLKSSLDQNKKQLKIILNDDNNQLNSKQILKDIKQ